MKISDIRFRLLGRVLTHITGLLGQRHSGVTGQQGQLLEEGILAPLSSRPPMEHSEEEVKRSTAMFHAKKMANMRSADHPVVSQTMQNLAERGPQRVSFN